MPDLPLSGATPNRFFQQRSFCVEGEFLKTYDALGGERVFGLPIGPAYEDQALKVRVQYFQYGRLEATEAGPGGRVVVGLAGDQLLRRQGRLR